MRQFTYSITEKETGHISIAEKETGHISIAEKETGYTSILQIYRVIIYANELKKMHSYFLNSKGKTVQLQKTFSICLDNFNN